MWNVRQNNFKKVTPLKKKKRKKKSKQNNNSAKTITRTTIKKPQKTNLKSINQYFGY